MSWFLAHFTPTPSPTLLRVLTTLLAASSVPLSAYAQQQAVEPVASRPGPKKAKTAEKTAPLTVLAEQVDGRAELHIKLLGQIELTRDQTRITSERADYFPVEDRIEAKSRVEMWRFGDHYTGDELKLTLDSGQGSILNPTYKLVETKAQGNAKRVDFINENEATVIEGTYSTCEGPDPDWYLKVNTLNIDTGHDVGHASRTVIYFKGVPILGTPSMSFPLSSARRSGVLPPTIGATSTGGGEVTLPYYLNIAPNRDVTFYPKFISRRGLQLGVNARYLGETYVGETNLEFLPSDRVARRNRYAFSTLYRQSFGENWQTSLNLNHASDDDYPRDFANSLTTSTRRQLIREWRVDYNRPWWNAGFRVQSYQILQDPAALLDPTLQVERPYDRLPQLTWHAGQRNLSGLDWAVDAEIVRFWHPDRVRAVRAVINPQVSFSFIRSAFFATPKLSWHASKYQLDGRPNPLNPGENSYTRTLPTASLNAGVVFERDTSLFGRSMTQTLEPRLFYVYTPFRDQRNIPLFDTAQTSFNFTQLFSENRFTGHDRISDANHLTIGVVSRFLESSGVEWLRLGFGQRLYIRRERVSLDAASVQNNDTRSDLLLSATGRISSVWAIDSSVQYNERNSRTVASNFGIQWKAAEKKVLNAEYRYLRNNSGGVSNNGFEQLNLSGQWPIAPRYYAVGRISYALPERRATESLAGLEYSADCWVVRAVVQRFATATLKANTTFFLQLELNGLSKLGSNPLEALSKNIPGYQKVN